MLYGTRRAAEYLGIKPSTLSYHIHVAKNLYPIKIGNSLVFTQDQLDFFLANRRKPGRPKKTDEAIS